MAAGIFHLIWLTGVSCDGCSIRALGDRTAGGIEALLQGVEGLPPIHLLHPILSFESGAAFTEQLRRAERGELGPFGVVNESAVPTRLTTESQAPESGGMRASVTALDALAPNAQFVIAWGDCAVWGGPHSLSPNPTGSTGTAMHLGAEYRSRLGLPVINMPGCAPPQILNATLVQLLSHAIGRGPALELDELNRPAAAYPELWAGALAVWKS